MWIIDFLSANCKNCYACVRACPAQAIKVQSEQAKIMEERCIGCGKCLKVCPKNAKHVQSELPRVKQYLQQKEYVVASIAPSFAALWGEERSHLPGLLKQMGFSAIEETVVGAELVTRVYENFAHMPGEQCYITSCCPTVNAMIQKHYPEVIPYLIPVVSPAACHSKLLKQKYGEQCKVVFIGPCLSKKIEGMEEKTLDAVLTFEEFIEWMEEDKVRIEEAPVIPFEATWVAQRGYPLVGGVTQTIDPGKSPRKIIRVDGIEECMELMPYIIQGQFKHTLIEMHGCRHGCIAGPGMPQDGVSIIERQDRVQAYIQQDQGADEVMQTLDASINLHKEFHYLKQVLKMPTDSEIERILNSIGKETPLDELNCGGCGYKTCRQKAVAVYNGFAEANMCLPFMRKKAETLTNVLFEATPNMIIMINTDLEIIEMNPSAQHFFQLSQEEGKELPISVLLDQAPFEQVCKERKNLLNQKIEVMPRKSIIIQSIIWSEYHQIMLWIANDITFDEVQSKKLQKMKLEAIDMAQQVINKQMTVAQEIASLLGETTAETKVTLTKLKKLIQEEEAIKQ